MLATVIFNLLLTFLFPLSGVSAAAYSDGATLSLQAGTPAPVVTAARTAVFSPSGHFFLAASQADEVQPIASLTKLMTALIFLENNPGWDKEYDIGRVDQVPGGILNLFPGDRVTVRDLFYTSLVASDNGATLALARSTGLSQENFVAKMNAQARQLGLVQTHFSEPSGLSDSDVSTAREVAYLAAAALARPEIRDATSRASYSFQTLDGQAKSVDSTDYLLFANASSSLRVLGGKTGYTDQAGYCFVGLWQDADGRQLIAVALDSVGKNERFLDSRQLANWAFAGYNWNNQ